MNPYMLVALVVLAVAATGNYYIGTRKNRWIAGRMSKDLEEAMRPRSTNYVNIGGSIGYNFTYALSGQPWTSAKGTFTMSPRHSLLYRPVSLLLGVRDRFYINVFTKRRILGEAHLVQARYLRSAKIDGVENMDRREFEAGGKRFVMLWCGPDRSRELEKLASAVREPARLRHFCAYPETRTFYIHMLPKEGLVKDDMDALLKRLPAFMDMGKDAPEEAEE